VQQLQSIRSFEMDQAELASPDQAMGRKIIYEKVFNFI
jgi:hypothetical protein